MNFVINLLVLIETNAEQMLNNTLSIACGRIFCVYLKEIKQLDWYFIEFDQYNEIGVRNFTDKNKVRYLATSSCGLS
jgi:hypothetical protein